MLFVRMDRRGFCLVRGGSCGAVSANVKLETFVVRFTACVAAPVLAIETWHRPPPAMKSIDAYTAVAVVSVALVLTISSLSSMPSMIVPPSSSEEQAKVDEAAQRGWPSTRLALHRARVKFVIVDAARGLGGRLRAIAAGMSVASSIGRPLLVME